MVVSASTPVSRRRVLSLALALIFGPLLAACARQRSASDSVSGTPPQPSVVTGAGVTTAVPPSSRVDGRGPTPTSATFYPSGSSSPPSAARGDSPAPAVAVWLRNHATLFTTAEPNDDFSDLQPLKQLIGDARIVALGEATHGTHEFQVMKHRLVRFLVTEMGFTDFALEANLPESEYINDYVHTGKGELKQLMIDLHVWAWNTEEIRDMIGWMREYNQRSDVAAHVSFHGFDLQSVDAAQSIVLAYLRRVNLPAAVVAEARFAYPGPYRPGQDPLSLLPSASTGVQTTYLANVKAVHDDLALSRDRYVAVSTPDEFANTLQTARIVVQAIDMLIANGRKEYGTRDRYMAENVTWLLERAGTDARMILWAHNEHISAVPAATDAEGVLNETMGTWLRRRYGTAIYVVGQTLFAGNCNVVEGVVTEVTILPPPDDSYEMALHGAKIPRTITDLRGAQPRAIGEDWLTGPHLFRSIGASYDEAAPNRYFSSVHLLQKFDALIYFEETTATKLLQPIV